MKLRHELSASAAGWNCIVVPRMLFSQMDLALQAARARAKYNDASSVRSEQLVLLAIEAEVLEQAPTFLWFKPTRLSSVVGDNTDDSGRHR